MLSDHGVQLDHARVQRVGLAEAVYASGKSGAQLQALIADAIDTRAHRLFTRLMQEQFSALPRLHQEAMDYDPVSRTGIVGHPARAAREVPVAVVSAGSSDAPVAFEAARTLSYHGCVARTIQDVGVAGLWRLLDRVEELRAMRVLIVVAGMEGALPSVLGGLVPGVIIAVPSSVGYGVSAGGQVALHSALASCAPGLVTVNIDNGYGAACAALRVLALATEPGASSALGGRNHV